MKKREHPHNSPKGSPVTGALVSGACAGAVNGLFGAGGGMVLIPLLSRLTPVEEDKLFPCSVATILPLCLTSLVVYGLHGSLPLAESGPYLLGSAAGGVAAGLWGRKIPTVLLHRALGLLILWGGIRNLC